MRIIHSDNNFSDAGAVNPVRSQGICGSCYAYSVTGAMEGAYFIKVCKRIIAAEHFLDQKVAYYSGFRRKPGYKNADVVSLSLFWSPNGRSMSQAETLETGDENTKAWKSYTRTLEISSSDP